MTPDEIIKAIECCSEVEKTENFELCVNCPYCGKCGESYLMGDILALVKYQKDESEVWKSICTAKNTIIDAQEKLIDELTQVTRRGKRNENE